MILRTTTAAAAAFAALTAPAAFADDHMSRADSVVGIVADSPDHETLEAAVKQAGLVEALSAAGPYTVFAPTDAAFGEIPEETVAALMTPEGKAQLTEILGCHVVEAGVMAEALTGMIEADGGAHAVPTLGGCTLSASLEGGAVVLTDEAGGEAMVTAADLAAGNGVVHVIDGVMMPKG